jgi:hypothetical protein
LWRSVRLASSAIIDYIDIIDCKTEAAMASITIRNLPDDVKERLRVRAAQHGRSLEAEARLVLVQLVQATPEISGLPPQYAHLTPDENGLIWPNGPDGFPVAAYAVDMADPSCTYRRVNEYDENGRW